MSGGGGVVVGVGVVGDGGGGVQIGITGNVHVQDISEVLLSSVKVGQAKTFHFSSAALGDTRAPAAPAPAPLPPTYLYLYST